MMYKLIVCLLVLSSLASCGTRVGLGDVADSATTEMAITSNVAHEANPILAPLGKAAPLATIPLKLGTEYLMIQSGVPKETAHRDVNAAGMFAACNNLIVLAQIAQPFGIGVGMICGLIYWNKTKPNKG